MYQITSMDLEAARSVLTAYDGDLDAALSGCCSLDEAAIPLHGGCKAIQPGDEAFFRACLEAAK